MNYEEQVLNDIMNRNGEKVKLQRIKEKVRWEWSKSSVIEV